MTIRLQDHAKGLYELRVLGRFVGSEEPVEVSDGQDLASETGHALCRLLVALKRRSESNPGSGAESLD